MVYVARTKENLEHCKCLDCPSYTLGCKIKNTPINLYKLMDDLDKTEQNLLHKSSPSPFFHIPYTR